MSPAAKNVWALTIGAWLALAAGGMAWNTASLLDELAAPIKFVKAYPRPAKEAKPKPRLEWGERLVNVYWRDVSIYTPACDGGSLDRKTSGNTLRGRDDRYPIEQTNVRDVWELELAMMAVPWRDRKLHEQLVMHPDGRMNHRWRLRVVGLDQKGTRRLPCDRVPYRNKAGELLPQRKRFDAFMHIDQRLARRIGINMMRIEEWEVGWFEVEEGSD